MNSFLPQPKLSTSRVRFINPRTHEVDSPPIDSPPTSPSSSPVNPEGPLTIAQIDAAASSKIPQVAGANPCHGKLINGGTSGDDDIMVIQCSGCGANNLIPLSKDVWYVVFCGVGVGVQRDLVCLPLIIVAYFIDQSIRTGHCKLPYQGHSWCPSQEIPDTRNGGARIRPSTRTWTCPIPPSLACVLVLISTLCRTYIVFTTGFVITIQTYSECYE